MSRNQLSFCRCFCLAIGYLLLAVSCQPHHASPQLIRQIDSLNEMAYALRYKNLGASTHAANKAYALSKSYRYGRSEAMNNMAFAAFMRMDFEQSTRLYKKVESTTRNEVEALIADVGLMKIAQRTSMNKEFYDYRNRALQRIQLIEEDASSLTNPVMKRRLKYAVSEFYIVSGIYYYYLQQYQRSIESMERISENELESDSAQWLYYLYMKGSGGMYKAKTPNDIIVGEFRFLTKCLNGAMLGKYVYFEANALQGLAELLIPLGNQLLLSKKRPELLRFINAGNLPLDQLSLELATQALQLFKRYGDLYQVSGCYRTIATYYNIHNQPEKSLYYLKLALSCVNIHHAKYYGKKNDKDKLQAYTVYNPNSLELDWIKKQHIQTIPEWIARLREQLSRTYSAMGRKTESDYNRNIYLDLLDYTRQDKELESRYAELASESKMINLLLTAVAVLSVLLIILIVGVNKRWRKHQVLYLEKMRQILELSRQITANLPTQVTDIDEVIETIELQICDTLGNLFDVNAVKIFLQIEPPVSNESVNLNLFPLVSAINQQIFGWVNLQTSGPMKKEDRTILNQLLPYLSWCLENGFVFVSLDEQRKKLETEHYLHIQHLADYKRQNIIKKACMAIVLGIFPYLDRIVGEVSKLRKESPVAENRKYRLAYIQELASKINEYNDILALWIKMRKGELSLHIDHFDLAELFRIIARGKRSFDQKEQTLVVREASCMVRADKALTLFMMNTLVENAHKFTPKGGRVEIYAEETPTYVEISVADNGLGLSEEDVKKILGEKVYDSGLIGMQTADNRSDLKQQKGHGFGLMNCKGIIDKYRKTNALFDVCTFQIESRLGQGSRFYFRLPKGVKKVLTCVTFLIGLASLWSCTPERPLATDRKLHPVAKYDSLLAIANRYANRVYNANILGEYETALQMADSVYNYLNLHYLAYSGKKGPLLKSNGFGTSAELEWWQRDFETDYYILLDVRNETAVASLACKDFAKYNYNNQAYTALYRQISKDGTLEEYCAKMEQTSTNKRIGVALLMLLMILCVITYYFLFLRHRLRYQHSLEQVFQINRIVLQASMSEGDEEQSMIQNLLQRLFGEFNELLAIENMGLMLYNEQTRNYGEYFFHRTEHLHPVADTMRQLMQTAVGGANEASGWLFIPLWVELGNERSAVGIWSLKLLHPLKGEADRLLVELTAQSLAMVLYQRIVSVRRLEYDIERVADEARRVGYEENMLHVQNMVLDNCLSTIKHETIYYPNRIKQMVDKMTNQMLPIDKQQQRLMEMDELVTYYKEIFTILSLCASRQLDGVTFKRSIIETSQLAAYAKTAMSKCMKRKNFNLELAVYNEPCRLIGDEVMVKMLIEILLTEAVSHHLPGYLLLKIYPWNDFVRFDFTDERRVFTIEALNEMFYPNLQRMSEADGKERTGTEFLLCKQIIREHDEYGGKRGCRINAIPCADKPTGFTIWFTIPLKKN